MYYSCNDIQKENLEINSEAENGYNNNIIEFVSYFDFVVFCIKNGLIPIMIFYQGSLLSFKDKNNNINNYNEYLENEQIIQLEKLCINTDNLYNILQNNLRKKENLIQIKKQKNIKNNDKRNKQMITNKSNTIINEYICPNCNFKNKLSDKTCINCKANNSEFLSKKSILKNIPKYSSKQKDSQIINKSQIISNKIKPLRFLNDKYQKSQDNIQMNNNKKIENNITAILNKRKKYLFRKI